MEVGGGIERDHPFKTSANFHDILPLPPYRQQFLLLSVGKFGKFLTPPPLKNINVLMEWSQRAKLRQHSH